MDGYHKKQEENVQHQEPTTAIFRPLFEREKPIPGEEKRKEERGQKRRRGKAIRNKDPLIYIFLFMYRNDCLYKYLFMIHTINM